MKKLLSYLLTPFFVVLFVLILVVFHPFLVIARLAFGQEAFQSSVNYLNLSLKKSLLFMGCSPKIFDSNSYDTSRPLIIVSNHQSLHDIPTIMWHFRQFGVKFVSKVELSKGIPSVSYNLRNGENILIDRKDRSGAVVALKKGCAVIAEGNKAIVIFPEGTRSRDGKPKKFSWKGFETLLQGMPEAMVVPVTINGSWVLMKNGLYPIPFGVKATWKVHPLIDPKTVEREVLLKNIEEQILASVEV